MVEKGGVRMPVMWQNHGKGNGKLGRVLLFLCRKAQKGRSLCGTENAMPQMGICSSRSRSTEKR